MKTAAYIMLTLTVRSVLVVALLIVYGIAQSLLFATAVPAIAQGAIGGGIAALIIWVAAFMRVPNPWGR